MNSIVQSRIERLNQGLDDLERQLRAFTPEQLNQRPAPGKWSAMQLVQHMMLAEGASMRYVQKKLGYQPKLKKAGLMSRIRSLLLSIYLGSPMKFKAPRVVGDEHLSENVNPEAVLQKWKDQRREMADYLNTLSEEVFEKEVYKHFLLGRISLPQMLQFFQAHFDRHRKQIDKALTRSSRQ